MEEFEKIVAEEFDAVPEDWRRLMNNCVLLVEDEPDAETLREQGIGEGGTLLGLYRGIPATERGGYYGVGETLPDSITIYRLPILNVAHELGLDPRIVVRETIWHEIAHHFGFSEEEVERREREATNRFSRSE